MYPLNLHWTGGGTDREDTRCKRMWPLLRKKREQHRGAPSHRLTSFKSPHRSRENDKVQFELSPPSETQSLLPLPAVCLCICTCVRVYERKNGDNSKAFPAKEFVCNTEYSDQVPTTGKKPVCPVLQ